MILFPRIPSSVIIENKKIVRPTHKRVHISIYVRTFHIQRIIAPIVACFTTSWLFHVGIVLFGDSS